MKKSAFAKTPVWEKRRTNMIVSDAIWRGKLKRKPCSVCGAAWAYAHHEDYTKPLKVVWLCPQHHADRHKELRKIHGIEIRGRAWLKAWCKRAIHYLKVGTGRGRNDPYNLPCFSSQDFDQ